MYRVLHEPYARRVWDARDALLRLSGCYVGCAVFRPPRSCAAVPVSSNRRGGDGSRACDAPESGDRRGTCFSMIIAVPAMTARHIGERGLVYNFRPVDRNQRFLLPVDMMEWLPRDHFVYFLVELVEALDTSPSLAGHRTEGRGGPPHDPPLMGALLV